MAGFRRLEDVDVSGKRVMVRVDFNVPVQDGEVSDDTRLRRALPTINNLVERGAKTILLSHFGRPGGQFVPEMSLGFLPPVLSKLLDGKRVDFADNCVGEAAEAAVAAMVDGDVLLLENTRFHAGETKNDPELASEMARFGDVFVADAFSVSHRAHVSSCGLASFMPACAGLAMERELDHLNAALGNPVRPVLAVVGGAKVSTKIDLLKNLVSRVDMLCVGGGMANTFLHALGYSVGKSLCEPDLSDTALQIMENAKAANCTVLLPEDVVVAREFAARAPHRHCMADEVAEDEMILDAGNKAVTALADAIDKAETVIWNGPLGAFELTPFDTATVEAARYCANATKAGDVVSVAGGGDTVAALKHAGVAGDFTFISTAGGAFLEWMEGKELPGVACLEK